MLHFASLTNRYFFRCVIKHSVTRQRPYNVAHCTENLLQVFCHSESQPWRETLRGGSGRTLLADTGCSCCIFHMVKQLHSCKSCNR
eukprot:g12877.t1